LAHRHAAPRRRALGHRHFEDAAAQLRLDALRVDRLGQLEAALERAVAAFEPQVAALAAERPSLARELERAAVGVELHVLAAYAGQLGEEDEVVVGLHEVEERLPAGERLWAPRRHPAAAPHESLLEELVEALLEP